jgi:hypothetical protein
MIFGSDSLFSDKETARPGVFGQRTEIDTPPYLYRDARPQVTGTAWRSRPGNRALVTTSSS